MSWTFIENKNVKGRKEHECRLCGKRIRKGAKHVMRFGFYDGEPLRFRMHEVCESKTWDWDEMDWETIGPGGDFNSECLALPLLRGW